ncbi:MAG: efflux RND transporter periplasmic adaptor subunit [Verrucomicrobia bacterium]|nr:efflux RND transporter periplasmic adaptor subunit [Verrucomicrobiota bacterium]
MAWIDSKNLNQVAIAGVRALAASLQAGTLSGFMESPLPSSESITTAMVEGDAAVPSALRADLKISHQFFEGLSFAIIKDPLSLKYFRLPAEDYALAALFDGKRSVAMVRQAFTAAQPQVALRQTTQEITERVQGFAQELLLAGFLETTAAATRHLLARDQHRRSTQTTSPWGWFMKMLFLKFPLWDPDAFLIRLEGRLRWIWSWTGFGISLIIFLAGLIVFGFNWSRIEPSLNDFLSLPNLALIWVLTILVKIIHEFGHGLTCKHYGGEVHEMGAMMMIFSPFLYADVTDSYVFPKKRHRILVAAAGIYIELVIAAVATLLWAISQPGPTQQLLFNLMLITSVWTVLFNANPLMKFDGYYMLTDLLDVPNLRTKAQMCVSELARRFFFGANGGVQGRVDLLPQRNRGWFVLYSVAAQLYLLQVTLGIAMLFHHLLKPYGLAWLGDWLGLGAFVSMLVMPVITFFQKQLSASAAKTSLRRPWCMLGGIALVLGLLLLVPWQIKVERPAVLQPVQSEFVRAEVAGRVTEIRARSGQEVKTGEVLAVLSQPRLSADARAAELREERARRELDMTVGASDPAAYRQAQAQLEQAKGAAQEAQRLVARLTLKAGSDGIVITPDLQRLAAGSLRAGDALCEIAQLDPIQIFIPLNERQARHIRAGQKVELRVPARPGRTFVGQVIEDAKTPPARELPPNLVATLGGDLAAEADAQGRLKPLETTYGVLVSIANADHALRPGMTGSARLHGDVLPVWKILLMKLRDFISLDYRL